LSQETDKSLWDKQKEEKKATEDGDGEAAGDGDEESKKMERNFFKRFLVWKELLQYREKKL
jgi:hypothetical protein